jgi:hypothetical protein
MSNLKTDASAQQLGRANRRLRLPVFPFCQLKTWDGSFPSLYHSPARLPGPSVEECALSLHAR